MFSTLKLPTCNLYAIQCRIHEGSPIFPILSRFNPISHIDTYFFKAHSNIVLPPTPSLPKGVCPVGLPVKILKALLPSSILTTWPVLLSLLDLITVSILGERYRLWNPSLWSLLHCPFSSLLGPNSLPRILFSYTYYTSLCFWNMFNCCMVHYIAWRPCIICLIIEYQYSSEPGICKGIWCADCCWQPLTYVCSIIHKVM